MDKKEFDRLLQECLENSNFVVRNKSYYSITNDLVVVVATQKSNYDNSIYINYAFYDRNIHVGIDYPMIQGGDIRGRFYYEYKENMMDSFPLNGLNKNELKRIITYNIDTFLLPVIEDGIKKYFEINPRALYTATKSLKEYLNL